MERERLDPQALSSRQLAVAAMVAGLSPAALYAGRVSWPWLLLAAAVGVALAGAALLRLGRAPLFRGAGRVLAVLYAGVGVLLAGRTLSRAGERIALSSGGVSAPWTILLLTGLLVWMGWGKAAAFFRAVEVLWLAMAVVLGAVLLLGAARVEWQYVLRADMHWQEAVRAMAELFTPALFTLPYIYKVATPPAPRRGLAWLGGLGLAAAGLAAVTAGLLGGAAQGLPHPFFVAAGLLGNSARWEGLLCVLWLLPDLTLAGLLCRAWGERRLSALAALLAGGLALSGLTGHIPALVYPALALLLFLLTLLLAKKSG